MEHALNRAKDWVIVGLIPVAVVASLPLLALLAFALRPVVLIALLIILVAGSLAWAFSGRFRAWVDVQAAAEICYKGLRLARDFAFHPAHSWARMNDVIVVGADDLVQATLGPVDKVELPRTGRQVRRGDRLFRLSSASRSLEVRAPVSGTVIATNDALLDHPELVNEQPFGRGWAVRLRGEDLRDERRLLLRGKRARTWFRQEVDRVVGALPTPGAPVRHDGGVRVDQLHRQIDDAAWVRMRKTMFAPPAADTAP